MYNNFSAKIDLAKLENTSIQTIQGRSGLVKCVVIPVEANDIYLSDKGAAYLDLTISQLKSQSQWGQTHMIKQKVSSKKYATMTPEERKLIPIIGNMSPMKNFNDANPQYQNNVVNNTSTNNEPISSDSLPF